jgi:hypothetical protein
MCYTAIAATMGWTSIGCWYKLLIAGHSRLSQAVAAAKASFASLISRTKVLLQDSTKLAWLLYAIAKDKVFACVWALRLTCQRYKAKTKVTGPYNSNNSVQSLIFVTNTKQ